MPFVAPAGTETLRILGVGSIFEVALVQRGETTCVCKRLTPRMRAEKQAHGAARREVAFLKMLGHQSCVPSLLGHGEDAFGPYILESIADGHSLSQLAQRGPLPTTMLSGIARASFRALVEIHDEPRHPALGDLAPEDLFVGQKRGAICFVDFGQSSWQGEPAGSSERGTLPYTPPEVARGEALWTQTSDVYALAAILVFAALGREPCRTTGPARLTEIGERGVDLAWLDQCAFDDQEKRTLSAALAFEPDARLQPAQAILSALSQTS